MYTPSYRDSGKIWNFQMKNYPISKQRAVKADLGTFSAQGASSAPADPITASSARDLELEICLTEIQKGKLALQLEVLWLCHADCSTDVNTEDSGTLSAPVDWPHDFAPGNFSSVDYDKLEPPDFVECFFSNGQVLQCAP